REVRDEAWLVCEHLEQALVRGPLAQRDHTVGRGDHEHEKREGPSAHEPPRGPRLTRRAGSLRLVELEIEPTLDELDLELAALLRRACRLALAARAQAHRARVDRPADTAAHGL